MHFQNYTPAPEQFYIINLTLGFINLILVILIVIYLINLLCKTKESDEIILEKKHRLNLITWGVFFLLITIADVLLFIQALLGARETLDPLVEKIAILLIYSGFFTKIIYIEHVINDLKYFKGYFFSIAFLAVMIFIAFLDINTIKTIGILQLIFLALLIIAYSFIPLLYLYLSIKTAGQSRKNAFKVSLGITLFGVGSMLGPLNLSGYYGILEILDILINSTLITGPIYVIIGTLLIFDTFRKKK